MDDSGNRAVYQEATVLIGAGRVMVGAGWWQWRGSITDKAEIHVREKIIEI